MTDRYYTLRAAQLKGLAVCLPSKACRTILIHDWSSGFGRCIVEATTWAEARRQLDAAYAEPVSAARMNARLIVQARWQFNDAVAEFAETTTDLSLFCWTHPYAI